MGERAAVACDLHVASSFVFNVSSTSSTVHLMTCSMVSMESQQRRQDTAFVAHEITMCRNDVTTIHNAVYVHHMWYPDYIIIRCVVSRTRSLLALGR